MPRKKTTTKALFDVWLRKKMATTGMTPAQVAAGAKVEEGTVSRWLNEGRLPERKQVAALSVLFGVSPADIFMATDPDEFVKTLKMVEERQPDEIDVLAQIPEIRQLMGDLARLTPKKRAALVMLAQESERGSETGSQ